MEFSLVSVRGGYFTASSAEKEVSLGSQKPRNTACCCMARKSEQLCCSDPAASSVCSWRGRDRRLESVRTLPRFSV